MTAPTMKELMTPLWRGNTVYAESVLAVRREGELPAASLLFPPERILSVTDSHWSTEYREGVDWIAEGGKLRLLEGTAARYLLCDQLFPSSPGLVSGTTCERAGGGWLLMLGTTPEGQGDYRYFHDCQLAVTYTHRGRWQGPVPECALPELPLTAGKLRRGEPITWTLYGDSIAEGYSSSGHPRLHARPYLPSWGELTATMLRQHYGAPVRLVNLSIGGKSSAWARDMARQLLAPEKADLVTIAFGMNDGTGRMEPDAFHTNIGSVMMTALEANPDTEFILVSPMVPNPEAVKGAQGTHSLLKPVLQRLVGEGVVMADMTAVSEELLRHKRYADRKSVV